MILFVRQRLGGADYNGIAGMDPDGIQVFHIADRDCRIIVIPHHLILDFFVALDTLFDQNLMDRRERQGIFNELEKLCLILGKSAASSAQCKGGTQHNGITDLFGNPKSRFNGIGHVRGQNRLPKRCTQFFEQLPIFCLLNAPAFGSKELHLALPQNAFLLQLHGKVKSGLSSDSREDRIRAFPANDSGDVFQRQRLHIYFVCDRGVGHNGCGIGIAENNLISLFFEGETGLRSRVVKFGGLPDHDRPGADDENLVDICPLRHASLPPPSFG